MKILQFSGGLDSLACLLLMREEHGLTVLTVQTDGAYPDVLEYLDRVAREFPRLHFKLVRSRREIETFGYPVDVIPMRWTYMGQLARGGDDVRYQDPFSCCRRAIWEPLDHASRALGATEVIRGQRNDDRLRSPLNDGDVDRGVTLRFPIATWSRGDVIKYVMANAPHLVAPGYMAGEKTSRDCMDCTAYLIDNARRIETLPPPVGKRVNDLLVQWRKDVFSELEA